MTSPHFYRALAVHVSGSSTRAAVAELLEVAEALEAETAEVLAKLEALRTHPMGAARKRALRRIENEAAEEAARVSVLLAGLAPAGDRALLQAALDGERFGLELDEQTFRDGSPEQLRLHESVWVLRRRLITLLERALGSADA